MGLCNIECIERIAQYLDVSPGKLQVSDKNVSIKLFHKNVLLHIFIWYHLCAHV